MSYIELNNMYKVYNKKFLAIDEFNLNIEKNEFIALIGPSGCGKSTLLRMIAGLEDITHGDLIIEGKKMNDVHAKNRDIAMVFQNYALYPHLDIYENIAFGLKIRKENKDIIDERVKSAAELLNLDQLLERKPSELSGGQRQRVALGRAIVQNSKIFLMDEPLSNLDAKLRSRMRIELLRIHKSLGVTTIYVTHDQVEAMTMADRIIVMNQGEIQQIGTPRELYYNPNNQFVAEFIGDPDINILKGNIVDKQLYINNTLLPITPKLYKNIEDYNGQEVVVGIRPEDFKIENIYVENNEVQIEEAIEIVEMRGDSSIIYTRFEDNPISIKTPSSQLVDNQTSITYTINQNRIFLFDKDTGARI